MTKRHIAFFTNETKAHTYSTLAIASALLQRGYRVTYATTEQTAKEIIQVGAEAIIYRSLDLHKQSPAEILSPYDPKNWELLMNFLAPGALCIAFNALSQVANFYNENRPDLFIYDPDAYAGRILAVVHGIPAIQISCYFAFYNGFYSQENCPWPDPPAKAETFAKLNQFFPLAFPVEELNIYTIPKAFQVNADSFDTRFVFSGPCIRGQATSDTPVFLKPDQRPTIVVSRSASASQINSDYEYFQTFIEALSGTKFRVILSIGIDMDPSLLGPLPKNFEISQNIPQNKIIGGAVLFFGSGGTVSTFEALYYGIPVVLIPQDMFHAEFSHRVTELGLGVTIKNNELTADSIRSAVARIEKDPTFIERVKGMQRSIRTDRGPDTVADRIEAYLATKS